MYVNQEDVVAQPVGEPRSDGGVGATAGGDDERVGWESGRNQLDELVGSHATRSSHNTGLSISASVGR